MLTGFGLADGFRIRPHLALESAVPQRCWRRDFLNSGVDFVWREFNRCVKTHRFGLKNTKSLRIDQPKTRQTSLCRTLSPGLHHALDVRDQGWPVNGEQRLAVNAYVTGVLQ